MKWNRWTRAGFAILAPVLVGGMLIAGEWAQSPASAQSGKAATSEAVTPKAGAASKQTRPEHVRELQQALVKAGYDPGPIDGIFGPRTKAALRKYVAVPPPQVPSPADKTISQFRTGEQRQGP
jgi:peptidoglycan hydrolase-like protein with peptidoglycan-binding domain